MNKGVCEMFNLGWLVVCVLVMMCDVVCTGGDDDKRSNEGEAESAALAEFRRKKAKRRRAEQGPTPVNQDKNISSDVSTQGEGDIHRLRGREKLAADTVNHPCVDVR